MDMLLTLLLILSSILSCWSFYLPGLAPVNYCEKSQATDTCKSEVKLYVNRLYSEESVIPYEYNRFDFCQVHEEDSPVENLGQVVFGERIRSSPYNISFLRNEDCKLLCVKKYDFKSEQDEEKLNFLMKGMLKNYEHGWIMDNMPVTWCYQVEGEQQYCSIGFPMGCYVDSQGNPKDVCVMNANYKKADTFYLFNHVDLHITYHSGADEAWGVGFGSKGGRITRIKVAPRSIKHTEDAKNLAPGSCGMDKPPMEIKARHSKSEPITIYYTYSVTFSVDNTIKWSSRWDYLHERNRSTNKDWVESNSIAK